MKKLVALGLILLMAMVAVPVIAKPKKNIGSAGKSDIVRMNLYEKDPSNWMIVEDGPWGRIIINMETGKFVFNGHGLDAGESYELIAYQDPWNGKGSQLLGSADANDEGDVHISGIADLPLSSYEYSVEDNLPNEDNEYDGCGSKIWLVLADDFDETNEEMTAWNPTEYLFEDELISCPE